MARVREPIRVMHVADKFGVAGSTIHGVSRFLARIFPRFDRDRFEVRLVGLRRSDTATEHLREQGLEIHCLGKGKFDLSTLGALSHLVREWRPDVLHLHGYGATNFGRLAARRAGVLNIVHEHFVDPAMPRVQVPWDFFLARCADQAIAVSHSVREFMVRQRFIPADRIELLRYGTPLDEFKPAPPEQVAAERRGWGIPPGARMVGTVGRLDEQKGLRYLLGSAPEILAEHPDVRFLMVGDGPLLARLRSQCERLGIADRVIFTGHASEVPLMLSMMDVQVFPSLWEGTPLAMFEAMSMCRAIVSTDVDGLGEVLRHGETALLVRPRDSEGLAQAVRRLLRDTELARRLASQAEVDSRQYDVQRTVDRLQEIYERLAA